MIVILLVFFLIILTNGTFFFARRFIIRFNYLSFCFFNLGLLLNLIAAKMYTLKSFYHVLIRLCVALLASHFVVVHSAEETWVELFTKKYYYLSLLFSMIIAFLLIECVYFVSKWIDFKFRESENRVKRMKTQFIFGFCLTAFHAFFLAMMLFYAHGENIFNSGYFEKLYVYILLFIFTLNVVYLLYFEYQKMPRLRYQRMIFNHTYINNLRTNALKANLPAVIYHEDKACFAVDFNGVKTSWPNTIEESMKLLNAEHYFQISRKGIVHRAAILSFSPHKIKCLKIELNIPCPIALITSRRKSAFFKEWLK